MDVRKLLLAAFAGLALMMLLSGLWHGIVMRSFYETHLPLMRDAPLLRIVALGYFVLAALMAVVYPKGYEGGTPWVEGLRFGMYMGILFTLPRALVLYGVEGSQTGMSVAVDAAWHMVEQGAGGVLIALIHGGDDRVAGRADKDD